jgi:hypothetical protein
LWDTIKLTGIFILHILVGVVLFCCIAGAAYGIFEATTWLEAHKTPYFICLGCHFVGFFLFGVDVICAGCFIGVTAAKFIKEIVKSWST